MRLKLRLRGGFEQFKFNFDGYPFALVQVAVQLREGAQASAEDIIAFAKSQVGSVQAPKQVHFVDDLPRSAVGKVQRREVRALIESGKSK